MPDPNVEIATLMLRRIVESMIRLQNGIDHLKGFIQEHNVAALLNNPNNLPTGFVKADYVSYANVLQDIETFLSNRAAFVAKFKDFFGEGVTDDLNRLGRKFWILGQD